MNDHGPETDLGYTNNRVALWKQSHEKVKLKCLLKFSSGVLGKWVTANWRKLCYGFQILLTFLALVDESYQSSKNIL